MFENYPLGLSAGVLLILFVVAMFFAIRRKTEIRVTDSSALAEYMGDTYYEIPTCMCGEPATKPMPRIKRSRGGYDLLRQFFAAPPRYKRVETLGKFGVKELCDVHAHVADAKIDEFLYVRIRGILSETNARLAVETAAFEKEGLVKALQEALTEKEKRMARQLVVPSKSGNGVTVNQILS